MPKMRTLITAAIVLSLLSPAFSQTESKVKIDPALFVYLKECRAVMRAVGNDIWKGWDISKTPILFYRPHVQDILIAYPHQPAGFQPLTGFNPLGEENIYYRDGTTFIDYDGQNTVKDIDGVKTLIVADTFSNQRNQLTGVLLGRDKDFTQKWLEDWGFLPNDPYAQMAMILHEGFHAFQDVQSPDKGPNEMAAIEDPLLDGAQLPGRLRRPYAGRLPANRRPRAAKVREVVAVRTERRAALKKEAVDDEDRAEYLEGLAKIHRIPLSAGSPDAGA